MYVCVYCVGIGDVCMCVLWGVVMYVCVCVCRVQGNKVLHACTQAGYKAMHMQCEPHTQAGHKASYPGQGTRAHTQA